jgi:hypothetical protein
MGQTVKLKTELTNAIYELLIRYFRSVSGIENVEALMMENPPSKETAELLREKCGDWYGEHFNDTIDMLGKYFTEEKHVYISYLQGGGYWDIEKHRPFTDFIQKEVEKIGIKIITKTKETIGSLSLKEEDKDNTDDIIKWTKENNAQFTPEQMGEYRDAVYNENEAYQTIIIAKSRGRITGFYATQCPIFTRQNYAIENMNKKKL